MNSKSKGSGFERDCSRMLSLWCTGGKRDDAIWRSASSGALTTVGKGRYLAHTGDFAATDGEAAWLFEHVIIEAKRGYNRYSMQDLLDVPEKSQTKNPVWQMVEKFCTACHTQQKWGLLLWKRDRRELLIFTRSDGTDANGLFARVNKISWMMVACPDGTFLYGLPWEQFTANVSGAQIRSLLAPPGASSSPTPSNLAP
jgi:hypothetical protein